MAADIGITKSANLEYAIVGDVIEYEIRVRNTGDIVLDEVIVKDLLSPDLNFIEGSLKLGGMPIDGDILAGVDIGPLAVNQLKILTLEAEVISRPEEDEEGIAVVSNSSTVVYTYTEDGIEKTDQKTSSPAEVVIEIAELTIEKIASVENVELGDIIDYRVTLTNVGTIPLLNVVLTDTLSTSVELVEGSVKVDGVVVNTDDLEEGINIGTIEPNEAVIVDYQVKVIAGTCSGYIENEACAKYNYQITENSATGTKETECVTVLVCVAISAFKQLGLSKSITLPPAKPNIEEIDDVVVEVIIDNTYVVKTIRSGSNEGQDLSGFKLVVHGRLKMSIEYTALLPTQPMHSAHCEVPFSSFIILPPDYVEGSYVEVLAEVESTDVDLIDLRSAMVNIMFLIIAKIN